MGNPAAIVIILIIIVLIILAVIFRHKFNNTADLGTYGPEMPSACTGTDNCTKPGTRTIVQYCIPHPVSGKGCVDKNGHQTFQPRIRHESCTLGCVKSEWHKEVEPCRVETDASCVPPGTLGKRLTILTCVEKDEVGSNACILSRENVPVETSFGATGTLPRSVNFEIGETVVTTETCTDYETPICGNWFLVVPEKDTVQPITLSDTVTACELNPFMEITSDCNTAGSDPFNVLLDGWRTDPMTCVFETDGMREGFTPKDMPFPLCPRDCSSEPFSAEDVQNETLNIDTFDPVVCGAENPECLRFCRYLPQSLSIGNGEFDHLLIKLLYLRNTSVFVSSECRINNNCPTPVTNNNDIQLQNIPVTQTLEAAEFGTTQFLQSTLMVLAPRTYIPGVLTAAVYLIIGTDLAGWMATRVENGNTLAYWKQAKVNYDGPGIPAIDAELFDISVDSPFQEFQEQFLPRTMQGLQDITLRQHGNIVFSEDVPLQGIQAVIFDIETDLTPRM